jgi:hypothetical protein
MSSNGTAEQAAFAALSSEQQASLSAQVEQAMGEGMEYEEQAPVSPRTEAALASAESGDCDTLRGLFTQQGLAVNATGEDGDTALHIAALHGQRAAAELCLSLGADVNARDEDESTPLHDAAAGGFGEICALLLAAGADAGARDGDGETALHTAARGDHVATVVLLLQHVGARRPELLAVRSEAGARAAEVAESEAMKAVLGEKRARDE